MDEITTELARRVAALESKVGELYARLDVVEPSASDAVAQSVPPHVAGLVRAGRREDAIRALLVDAGLSVADATARISAYSRSIGR